MTQEVLKQALEALENLIVRAEWHDRAGYNDFKNAGKAVTAIKEALSQTEQIPPSAYSNTHQPEQEPVAHMNQHGVIHEAGYPWGPTNRLEPLYTAPPQRKPLTDEEFDKLLGPFPRYAEEWSMTDFIRFARAIEAAHGIKENT